MTQLVKPLESLRMPPKGKGPAKVSASVTETAEHPEVEITGSSSDSPGENTVEFLTVKLELKCSIMDAQKTIPKFKPGNVGRAEAASTYINWSSKIQSWMMLIGLDGFLKVKESEIASDASLSTLDTQFYALLHVAVDDAKASSIITQSWNSGLRAWHALRRYYASDDSQAIENLNRKLESCKLTKNESIEEWLIRLRQMESILLTTGSPKTEKKMLGIIRRNLPAEYGDFIRTIHLLGVQSRENFEEKLIAYTELLEGMRGNDATDTKPKNIALVSSSTRQHRPDSFASSSRARNQTN